LFYEAGWEGDIGEVVTEPGAATLGERRERVVDQLMRVVIAVRTEPVMAVSVVASYRL
jgi:hypothetical protein